MENCELYEKCLLMCCLPVHRPHKEWLESFISSAWQVYLLLYQASDIGLVMMVRELLKMGADVCAKTDDGKRALHRTTFKGHHDIVRLPLENKIEVDEEDGNEQTAWNYASTNG
jgi:hypothetical protein